MAFGKEMKHTLQVLITIITLEFRRCMLQSNTEQTLEKKKLLENNYIQRAMMSSKQA